MSAPPTLTRLLRNFVNRVYLDFSNLLETLERTQEYQKRKDLLQFLETTRQQLVRLMVLVKWLARSSASMKRAQDMVGLLNQRDATYYNSQQFLRVLSSKLEDHMFPMWDVTTAIHVMTSGSYRLLPKMLESKVEWNRTIPAEKIAQVTSRLDDKLHIHLLTTVIPPAFTNIRVKGGIVKMTVDGEFEVGLSLRMKAQNLPHLPQFAEKDRIQWLLFDLKLLLGVELAGNELDSNVVRDVQLKDLTQFLRYQMSLSTTPIVSLHDKLHTFCVALEMDILHLQSAKLNALFGGNLIVEYDRHQKLSLKYWRSAPPILREGSTPEQKVADIQLAITVYNQQLAIEHEPALPEMETWTEAAEEGRRGDLRIYPDRINLTRVFLAVIGAHANYRVKQLFQYMRNAPPRGYERLELVDELVECRSANEHMVEAKAGSSGSRIKTEADDMNGSAKMEDESQTHMSITSGRAVVTSLFVTLLGERQIRITVDSRDGKLVFEWVQSMKARFGSSLAASLSVSPPSLRACGSFVSPELVRLLGTAQIQLNSPQYSSRILEIMEELRLTLVLELAEQLLTSLYPKGQPQLQVSRHPGLLWPKNSAPLRSALYIRLVRDPSFFVVIRILKSTSHSIRPKQGDHLNMVTFMPSYQASFSLLQALPRTDMRAPKESSARREAKSQGLLLSTLPTVCCTVNDVLTIQLSEPLNIPEILALANNVQLQEGAFSLPFRALGEIPPDIYFDCAKYNVWNKESLSQILAHCDWLVPRLFLRCRLLTHDPPFSLDRNSVDGGVSSFEVPLRVMNLYPVVNEPLEEKLRVYVQAPPLSDLNDKQPLTFYLVHASLAVLAQTPLSSLSHGAQLSYSQMQNNHHLFLTYPQLSDSCVRDVFRDLESLLTLLNVVIQLANYAQLCDPAQDAILPRNFFNASYLSVSELHLSCGSEQKMIVTFHERDRRVIDKVTFGSVKLRFLPLAYPQTHFLEREYNSTRKLMNLLRRVYFAHLATPIIIRHVDTLLASDSVNTHPALGLRLNMYMEVVPAGSRLMELVGHSASCVRIVLDGNQIDLFMLHPKRVVCSMKLKNRDEKKEAWEVSTLNERLGQLYSMATKFWMEGILRKGPLFGLQREGAGYVLVAKDSTSFPSFSVYARYFAERMGNLTRGRQRQFMRSFWTLLSSPPQILAELGLLLEVELRDSSIALWLYDSPPAHLEVDLQTQCIYFTLAITLAGSTTRVLLPLWYCQGNIGSWELFIQRPNKRRKKDLARGLANLLVLLQRMTPSAILDLLN